MTDQAKSRDCPHGHQMGKCDTCRLIEAESEIESATQIINQQHNVLGAVSNALKGQPEPLTLYSTHGLGKVAQRAADEIKRLRRDCAEAYQCVGEWIDADESGGWIESRDKRRLLVNLKAAADGRSRTHDDLLPWPKGTVD